MYLVVHSIICSIIVFVISIYVSDILLVFPLFVRCYFTCTVNFFLLPVCFYFYIHFTFISVLSRTFVLYVLLFYFYFCFIVTFMFYFYCRLIFIFIFNFLCTLFMLSCCYYFHLTWAVTILLLSFYFHYLHITFSLTSLFSPYFYL